MFSKISNSFFLTLVYSYRVIGGPHMGGCCRFNPSCSEYAIQALKTQNTTQALRLISKRLLLCRPGGPFGYDPIPNTKQNLVEQ